MSNAFQISKEQGQQFIKDFVECEDKGIKFNGLQSQFYFMDNNLWIGIDNRTNKCYVEEFQTLEECLKWLDILA